ncbi:MAG: hypothetical protein N3E36_05500 [Sulfolobales archaeon]|nr:hypothetical protein [Sulfolobales archaeon]
MKEVSPIFSNLKVEVQTLQNLPKLSKIQEIVEHYIFDGETLLSKSGRYAVKSKDGSFIVYTMRNHKAPLELLYWIQLLKRGMTFVHASGATYNEKALIFPAWPETGKTSLIVHLLGKSQVFQFLGDDMVIISRNGDVYPYLKPFAVYLHHKNLFHNYFKNKPLCYLRLRVGHTLAKLGIYSRYLKSLKIMEPLWIPYSEIFPNRRPAEKGKLSLIYLLKKADKFKLTPIEVEDAARLLCLHLIYDLIAPVLQDAIIFTHFGFFNIFNALEEHYKILCEALEKSEEIVSCSISGINDLNKLADIILCKLKSHLF